MLTIFLLTFFISSFLILINSAIAKKSFSEREKLSPFECGFDPKSSARIPFSLRFYLISLVFLIFDVEITLILPIPLVSHHSNLKIMLFISAFFLLILLMGLFHEWNESALEWDK